MGDVKDDGGAAFPHRFEDTMGHPRWHQSNGMTLRDWFAGQALAGMSHALNEGDVQWVKQHGAKVAYGMADAMLAARKGGDA